jgi:hypothetical protein
MKTITVSKKSRGLVALLKQAQKDNLLLTSPDGIDYILAEVDDFDREIMLTQQNNDLMAFLEQRALQPQTISLDEVKRQLGI